jgi:hypothetical protein
VCDDVTTNYFRLTLLFLLRLRRINQSLLAMTWN